MPLTWATLPHGDWLLGEVQARAQVRESSGHLELSNGLVSRTFRLDPSGATVAYVNQMTGESLLRATGPEARVKAGPDLAVGGLTGQPNRAFLLEHWLDDLRPIEGALKFTGYTVDEPLERLTWKRTRHAPPAQWPPNGKAVTLTYEGSSLRVELRYELYDGIPLLGKRMAVTNHGRDRVRIDSFDLEHLSLAEVESSVDRNPTWRLPNLTVVTDYSFGGMAPTASNRTVYWEPEPEYDTQVNFHRTTPCKLVVRPPHGPGQDLAPGERFESFWAFTLVHDSTDRERQGLAERRMMRTLAPWATENPLMLHLTSVDPAMVKRAVDQCADVGFEMIVISFWSGLDMEDETDANRAKFRELREYANAKGIELGGYSLLASRRIDDENDVINPRTGKPGGAIFGNSPCLESAWGHEYFRKVRAFLEATGFNLLEHDGNYPGDLCASTRHPGHRDVTDSQWNQHRRITDLYRWCLANGVYLNVPDNYFLRGSNKTGMGYRESNWSLPREHQHIHARQNLYDGTWQKTPSMGWMMVPLVEYQGGGAAATLEPLNEHLEDYGLHLANNLGFGAQACYRGPRLYDTPATREVVAKWVAWFKEHRAILESDVIHVRRADGRAPDGIVHVNPELEVPAMAVLWNPLDQEVEQEFVLPLYYSGLRGEVEWVDEEGRAARVRLDDARRARLNLRLPPRGMRWIRFR